ncbi:protein THEM6-like [Anoplophora glabripennis]|uniref:protein THEM6-like n=1 Tax=Anoplophora glabripennis TaxID=217634 RepID=UPI0008756A68|nr:protein THEM6-like [Anoplophora glabripennis]
MVADSSCLLCYSVFATVVALLYILFDVNYFLRIIFTIVLGKLFDKKKKVDESTEIYGVCTSQDLDIFFKHMNNARYVRDLDFARFHFYERTGLYDEITKAKGHVLQTASNIRYRRTIPLFNTYKVTTKIVYWEEKTLYIEQQFITLSDGFIRAIVLSKQGTIGLNVPEIMAKLTGKHISYRPTPPDELQDWLNSMEKSSARLRKKD